ncbi:MAG: N-acetyl sugar amidotransferase [Proteobacteria bacterium]|nr:N-acetyl sugar amidotransferase [Pseudomonadota bacterium]MBU4384651.1 N-acetyl sugar amidotransferase [Pseudomonadota bacterium]
MRFGQGREYQICSRCIMDTTEPEIVFDENGVCNHCTNHLERIKNELHSGEKGRRELERIAGVIKEEGKNKKYDCIIGVSGGVDSTMVAYHVKELGLRPLAVHLDNSWDSELAVSNIEKTLNVLGIDLYTKVLDWGEFKNLQMSFLLASVPNAEIPTDHAIISLLYHTAAQEGVRYIIHGGNVASEGIMPSSWMHYNQDLRLLKGIHRRYGSVRLKNFPKMSLLRWGYHLVIKGVKYFPILNYVDYDKEQARNILTEKLSWRPYGAKHYESIYTRFFQSYFLPEKFNIDKRKAHFSSLICSGQMTREQALAEMAKEAYPEDMMKRDKAYVIKKFAITEDKFDEIMKLPIKQHTDYPSNIFFYNKLAGFKDMVRKRAKTI